MKKKLIFILTNCLALPILIDLWYGLIQLNKNAADFFYLINIFLAALFSTIAWIIINIFFLIFYKKGNDRWFYILAITLIIFLLVNNLPWWFAKF